MYCAILLMCYVKGLLLCSSRFVWSEIVNWGGGGGGNMLLIQFLYGSLHFVAEIFIFLLTFCSNILYTPVLMPLFVQYFCPFLIEIKSLIVKLFSSGYRISYRSV